MSMPDYYKILGVARNATQAEIQKAYRALLRKYHPDINPGNKQAEEKTKEINAAYDILGDQEKRHNYDIELTMSEKSSQSYTNYSNYTNNDDDDDSDDYYDSDDDDDDDKEYYEYDEEVERNSYKFNQSYRRKSSNNSYNSFETLKNTPIFTILENFDEYPFNVATKAIYKHGFFPLFGNSIACGFIIIGTIINRIYKLFAKEYLFKHETYSIKTFEWLNECIIENKLLKYTWWGIVLASMAAFKLFVFAAIIFVGLLILLLILISSGKRKK